MSKAKENFNQLETSDREKRTWLFSLTLFFMVVIFLVWIVNLKSFVNPQDLKKSQADSNFNWTALKNQFDTTMSEMDAKLAQLNPAVSATTSSDKSQSFINSLENNLNNSSTVPVATSTAVSTTTSSDLEIEAIKARLNELDKKIKTQP